MRLTLSILAFSVLGLTACENPSPPQVSRNPMVPLDTPLTETISTEENSSYQNAVFPLEDSFITSVLTVGSFHEDEVAADADKAPWSGLFKNGEGYYIAPTGLKTKRVYDPVIDETEKEKTGREVQTTNKDTAVILVSGASFLTTGRVLPADLSKTQVFPGDTVQLRYDGVDYKLFATGDRRKSHSNTEEITVRNYRLYLMATVKGQLCKSLLVAQENFDDAMITVLFAGDLDGDGILDLVIDTSRHYNVSSPTLYLSKPAGGGQIVKPVGAHITMGC